MRAKLSRIILFSLLIISFVPAQQKLKEKDLPQRYREWLNQTRYIMYEEEREVFLQLASDRERDQR